MTRKEQIKTQADIYTDDSSNYCEWSDDGGWSDTNDIELIEKAFIEGANWADEHPNLYNNEKYHTVKVSCLDELNRKATLYDNFLEKACEWVKKHYIEYAHNQLGSEYMINDLIKAMEE